VIPAMGIQSFLFLNNCCYDAKKVQKLTCTKAETVRISK